MRKQTISFAITRFVALICILLALLITTLVINKVVDSNKQLQRHDNKREANAISDKYKTFLNDRLILLQEHSKFPLMLQTLMQPESHLGKVSDFMAELTILGKQYNEILIDFSGHTIYSSQAHSTNYHRKPWLQPLLNSQETSAVQLVMIDQQYYWVLASAINYHGISQGVLLIEIPIGEIYQQTQSNNILDGLDIEIIHKKTSVIRFGEKISGQAVDIKWEILPITLRVTFDQKTLTPQLHSLIFEIAFIIAAITLVILITAYLYAYVTFVKPLVSLADATEQLEQGQRQPVLHENIRILEFSRLFKKFNNMVRKVEQREVSLKAANEQLTQANLDRKLSESQLVQSEKMASIGILAAGMAHEINNPIGFIKSNINVFQEYVQSLTAYIEEQKQLLSDEQHQQQQQLADKHDIDYILTDLTQLLASSMTGVERVSEIVINLKDFSRLDAPEKTLMDVNEGLQATIKMAHNEIKYHCELHLQLGELSQIMAYPGKLNQVFMNLIINAGQAITDKGDIYIRTFQSNGFIIVEIEDTGSGIKAEDLKSIFTPFYTTKEVGKGTGLGLSICHNIIKQHDGRIEVHSEVGKGTTFAIYLAIE
ncbi:sensor histidine kinase [Psychromonas sp. Urea-02u-13]|uniref:sensor histidine kinase n=1 Tax=Psychromonas sp. Urea-02u-13 TaxID=2058326 RepID=UPI000C33C52C|nr:ATP-binding protein [Psychromonas sp. Urea-02u-13]PKG37942.1 two-component sensor histidine kinase [Psychromonas sp. Urea-02u-13]